MDRLAGIVSDGQVTPHRDGTFATILPVVWLTTNPTVDFWIKDPFGR